LLYVRNESYFAGYGFVIFRNSLICRRLFCCYILDLFWDNAFPNEFRSHEVSADGLEPNAKYPDDLILKHHGVSMLKHRKHYLVKL
jgi:hypothetical protein